MDRRVVLVTGAASGIGAATCRALASPETAVMAHLGRDHDLEAPMLDQLRARGALAEAMCGDLANPDLPDRLVAGTIARFGALHVVVSNAGFADRTPISALTDAAFARSIDAIQWAFLRLARAALPHLRRAPDARIVAVSSFVAHAFRVDVPSFPASAAAKAGMEALVRALALELAPDRVTVNAVVPGFIRKDAGTFAALDPTAQAAQLSRVPLGRLGSPDEVAAAIAFLASPQAGYITGQALHVSGGLVI